MADLIPHFDLPFRLSLESSAPGEYHAATVEQDSMQDIANCVEAIMLTPVGWRDDHPGFGIPDLTFKQLPIGPQTIEQLVSEQESRVAILITEEADRFDQLVDRIRIGLQARGGETL